MIFRYQVIDKNKQLFQGELEADDIKRARLSLMEQGYDVLLLEPTRSRARIGGPPVIAIGHVSTKDKMLFVKHLSLMIKSGLVLDEAIEALHEQARGRLRAILFRLLTVVRKGNFLSEGLKLFPYTFNDFFINMVRIGEQSGTLSESLLNLSTHLQKEHSLRSKIRSAMLYPSIVLIALGGLGMTVTIVVLPKLLGFFEALDVEIPLITRIFMRIAKFIEVHWLISILALVTLIVLFVVLNKLRFTKLIIHWSVFHLPILHRFSLSSNLASFTRSMSLLLHSGNTIDEALEIMQSALNNRLYQVSLRSIIEDVRRGGNLSDALSRHRRLYPGLVTRMVHVGEISGNLEETFGYLAEFFEDELDTLSKNLSNVIEPVLLIFIGLVIAFVAMSILSPIYQLTASVR